MTCQPFMCYYSSISELCQAMLRSLKLTTLGMGRRLGILRAVAGSGWRKQRLLILCYHGLSLKDEHKWRNLFVTPAFFRSRLDLLARLKYRVLPLGDAVRMLHEGGLPPKSVTITFDDGFHDFHQFGFPLLSEFGFPATVYQMTSYCDHAFPVFNLVLSYVFWRSAGCQFSSAAYGVPGTFDLAREEGRDRAVEAFRETARQRNYTPEQKNDLAAEVAAELGVDYAEILRLRMLRLMTTSQISEVAAGGVDVQLHTHNHGKLLSEDVLTREIDDNRRSLAAANVSGLVHFCYPRGDYSHEMLPWLRAGHIQSATTCDPGLATRTTEPLLLPRFLDYMSVTEVEFEGWLSGVSSLLPHRGY
jgi:peptidoglycan/xylan/chitin deacetylase (PgdA/CDA1 family)